MPNVGTGGGLYGSANQWFQQPPAGYFPGSTVAGFTPAQTNAWDMMRGGAAQTAGAANDVWGSYANNLSGMNPGQNPWLDQAVGAMRQNSQQQYDRQVQPGINAGAVSAGGFGGSRHGVNQAIMSNDLNQNMMNTEADMRLRGYGQDLQHMRGMYGMAPGMMGAMGTAWGMPGATEALIGAQQQGMNQGRLTDEVNRWNYSRDIGRDRIMDYGAMLGQIQGGPQSGQLPMQSNPWTSALGGAMMGNSLANSFSGMWGGGGSEAGEMGYPSPGGYGGWGY